MSETTTNLLIQEKSPYLLQHADNPVAWFPWGERAFDKARQEDKPIFLSIGYSTCHWCHVMAHESFENKEIAAFLNDHFISIKVDREERPDIDNIYMTAVQAMTGSGGWPLSVFLTSDLKPFYGGTYFPPYAKWGTPGFLDLLSSLKKSWDENRQHVLESADQLTNILTERARSAPSKGALTEDVLKLAADQFESMYDDVHGGFGQAPKFPTSHNLSFLLRYFQRTQDKNYLNMVEKTLQHMAEGGIYDQIGGGFHRYAVDQEWQIPHFEKMLYDQAILVRTYLEAYQITKNPFYARIAREVLDYVLRDMTDQRGGFYSAEDADSLDPYVYQNMSVETHAEKKEGAFYLFRYEDMQDLLSAEEAQVMIARFGIKKEGNAKSDPHGEFDGVNVLDVEQSITDLARQFKLKEQEVERLLDSGKAKLYQARNQRPRPHLDDKILTDWNGLMIGAFAMAGRVLQEEKYTQAAEQAAQFILKTLYVDHVLFHRFRDGEAGISATVEDYAFFIHGLLELYQSTFVLDYLEKALALSAVMKQLFWDEDEGGFFFVGEGSEEMLFQQKELYDGALPSGNSMATWNLVRLYHLTFQDVWREMLDKQLSFFAHTVLQRPSAYGQFLNAVDFVSGPSREIVFVEGADADNLSPLMKEVSTAFLPRMVAILKTEDNAAVLSRLAPFTEDQHALRAEHTVYVCENKVCQLPVTSLEELRKILKKH